jgi:hypothetical protein
LTPGEVASIRAQAICKMMTADEAREVAECRGFDDIEPWNAWETWQKVRARFTDPYSMASAVLRPKPRPSAPAP